MDFPLSKYDFRKLAWRGILLTIATAMVFVFLGPAIDHHFAERQHNHTHLYLTASAAEHGHPDQHPFEESHSHFQPGTQLGTQLGTEDHGTGVLYQTSNDGLGESGSVSVTAVIDDGLAYPLHRGESLSHAVAVGEGVFLEAYAAPPDKPPRA